MFMIIIIITIIIIINNTIIIYTYVNKTQVLTSIYKRCIVHMFVYFGQQYVSCVNDVVIVCY